MKRMSIWTVIGVALVSFGIAKFSGAYHPSVERLEGREMCMVFGGTNYPCKKTMTTCPDPNGAPATCQYNATLKDCWQCKMQPPSFLTCSLTTTQGYTCIETISTSSPYCGYLYTGGVKDMTCPSGACGKYATTCGQQYGTVVSSGGFCP